MMNILATLVFSFTLNPQVCAGPPCPVVILFTIERDASNRNVNMVVEGDRDGSERREWDMPLDGEGAPRLIQVTVTLKGVAEYEFKGTLSRNGGKEFQFKRFVKVGVQ